jgi:histidinol-phosphate aminotransferase
MQVNKNIVGKSQYTLPYIESYRHKLDVIQNYFPHHQAVEVAIVGATAAIHEYPYHDRQYMALIAAICDYLGQTTPVAAEPATNANITLTNGSDTALKLIIEAFVTPESRILVPVPTYPHFQSFLDNVDNAAILTPYVVSAEQLECLDFKGVNVCYLVTPNLPLGYVIGPDVVESLATKYPSCLFVVDEAYIEFGGGYSAVGLAVTRPNVAVVRTFSKAFGLAGLRIGYLVMSAARTRLISPLVNEKAVTAIAQAAALAALDNRGHYLAAAAEIEYLKSYLVRRLDKIIGTNTPIFDYSVDGGNFFMLYARDSALVCNVFAAHGIMIRNKHSDVPNSIRVCMGPKSIMKDVISVCKVINIEAYVKSRRVIFDLDLTLRDGASPAARLYESADMCLGMPGSAIVSNNGITPAQVANYLARVGDIYIDTNRIQTSLSAAKRLISAMDYKVLLYKYESQDSQIDSRVASPIGEYFNDVDLHSVDTDDIDVILLTTINIDTDNIAEICRRVSMGTCLIYTDESLFCDINNTNEFADLYKMYPSFKVPDMASYVKLIKEATGASDDQFISVGKPYMNLPPMGADSRPFSLMIGDSDADYAYAKRYGLAFIRVGAAVNRYNFDKKYIELRSVDDIFM